MSIQVSANHPKTCDKDNKTMDSTENKRKSERFELDLLVNLTMPEEKEHQEVIAAHTKDISSEGAYVEVDEPLKEGTPVRLELFLSIDRLMALVGESHKGYKISTLNRLNGR